MIVEHQPEMTCAHCAEFYCHPTFWRINECWESLLFDVYGLPTSRRSDGPIRSKNYGIESGCRADKHQVSHVKCLVYMYKCFNKKHSIVDSNAKTQTRFTRMTMHDVSKYKKSNPNCFQAIRQRTSVYEILVYNPRPQ